MNQKQLYAELGPISTLSDVQTYIRRVIEIRGFGAQTVQTTLLLLIEEVGELAKAIRKNTRGMSFDSGRNKNYDTVESEIADVFIVLISICNNLGIDLFEALKEKEKINCSRTWQINEKSSLMLNKRETGEG